MEERLLDDCVCPIGPLTPQDGRKTPESRPFRRALVVRTTWCSSAERSVGWLLSVAVENLLSFQKVFPPGPDLWPRETTENDSVEVPGP